MDKVKRDKDGIVALENVPAILDEIIDWINARDEHIEFILTKLKDIGTAVISLEKKVNPLQEVKPSIEQELESGLDEKQFKFPGNKTKIATCTRIFLPAAKWEEVDKSKLSRRTGEYFYFHDIPVFSYSGNEIIFCTD